MRVVLSMSMLPEFELSPMLLGGSGIEIGLIERSGNDTGSGAGEGKGKVEETCGAGEEEDDVIKG